jgi:hypothetical protein
MERIHAIPIRREAIRQITFHIPAQIPYVKLGVAIQNRLQIAYELRRVGEPLVARKAAQIQIAGGAAKIVGMSGVEKRFYRAFGRIAIQGIFVLRVFALSESAG